MEKDKLLKTARTSLETAFSGGYTELPESSIRRGAFVTLYKGGKLRGCIGYLTGIEPLYREIYNLARAAAFDDYRFPPLKEEELDEIEIEISVLTEPEIINSLDDFILGRDGIIMALGNHRAVFLPQVADETGWTKKEMLEALSVKAGMEKDAWTSDEAIFSTFQAEVFSESKV